MTAAEQEQFYHDLRKAHPSWSALFASGYVHGWSDEGIRTRPNPAFVDRMDDYSMGYLTGFAVQRGDDAAGEPWFRGAIFILTQEALRETVQAD